MFLYNNILFDFLPPNFQLYGRLNNLFEIIFLSTDEYGRPFLILKEQQAKSRVKGIEAVKVGIIR